MTKREIESQERKFARLARRESLIHDRLLGLRGELDVLVRQLDRLTFARPRAREGMSLGPNIAGIVSLARFRQRRQP
jgi:hypothetical protein